MRITRSLRSLLFALAVLTLSVASLSVASYAQIGFGISVNFAPPELPVYEQPICPGDGYIWNPGYWGWGDDDYYWVPGTWVEAPEVGFLWTPPYWGWGGGGYLFHEGYWGSHVGFYGGISYGFGYFGEGYEGGRWDGGHFFYNRAVNNVNVTVIHNTYNTTINHTTINRVSFNGGNGGVQVRASAQETSYANERHIPPVAAQSQHLQAARSNPELRASANHGRPPVAATSRPADFKTNVVPAREGGRVNERPANAGTGGGTPRPGNTTGGVATPRPGNPSHVNELPAHEKPAPTSTGNPKLDQKYQKQQDKLYSQQEKERQKVQQKQEQDHQRLQQKQASDAQKQQVEQRHQQQTQQLAQKHQQQVEHLQSRQQPHSGGGQPKH